jgi:hypothetical protein
MIKHIIGFALFTFIVACGVIAYAFLSVPPIPRVEEVRPPVSVREPVVREVVAQKPLSYELQSFEVDLEKGTGTVQVKLKWNSNEKPPAGLRFDFGLTTPGEPFAGTQVGSYYITGPFKAGRSITETCVFKLWGAVLNPVEKNYYGYAEIVDRGTESAGITKLVYTEKDRMIGAISALVRHPLKK